MAVVTGAQVEQGISWERVLGASKLVGRSKLVWGAAPVNRRAMALSSSNSIATPAKLHSPARLRLQLSCTPNSIATSRLRINLKRVAADGAFQPQIKRPRVNSGLL